MNFLLIPFSWLYGLGVFVRNTLYDRGLLKSRSFDLPVIVVGNLRVGGTGKTPMTMFLLEKILATGKRVGMVSRGYGRKTMGHMVVKASDTPEAAGDEPLVIKRSFPGVHVAVDENRVRGILSAFESPDAPEVIVLDDAMQHRKVQPGLLIMLSAYHNLFYDDYLLPAGRLREPAFEANRADVIIVTKCPEGLDVHTRRSIRQRIMPMHHQKVYFSFEHWSGLRSIWDNDRLAIKTIDEGFNLLITGVADAHTIELGFEERRATYHHLEFKDHHEYDQGDIQRIIKEYEAQPVDQVKRIITTEKDASKLLKWKENEKFAALPIFALEHEIRFFQEDGNAFEERIDEFIRSYH